MGTHSTSACVVALSLVLSAASTVRAQAPDTSLWVTDGIVYPMVQVGTTLYVGGQFSRVGPHTGAAVPLSAATGQPQPPFARVPGAVNAVVSDGGGGWFVGGRFTGVEGTPRRNLVHLLANGSVAAWSPDPDSEVFALAVSGGTLYVGGRFEHLGGQARYKVGAVDVVSGAATAFDAGMTQIAFNTWPYIRSLAVGPGAVYVGGFFYTIGGASRSFLAALDPATGAATPWDPHANGQANAIVPAGGTVYVGGYFSSIGGASRSYLAQLDAGTAAATAWDPHPDAGVNGLALTDTQIYAGGLFTHMGVVARKSLAAFDRGTGALLGFDANVQGGQFGTSPVYGLAAQGTSLYVAGDFTNIGGQAHRYLAALDATTAAAQSWDADVNATANTVAVEGGTVFAGGRFWMSGGVPRANLAAIDLANGRPTTWAPATNDRVTAMVTDGTVLYLGGYFTLVQGLSHPYLAKLDLASGAVAAWNPGASNVVSCLTLAGPTLYVGGYFNNIGGGGSPTLAAVDATSGSTLPWTPATIGGPVHSIVPDLGSNAVMVASQGGLWRFRASDGATLWTATWYGSGVPAPLVLMGSTLYVGGRFPSIDGEPRANLAALDAATNTVLPWAPEANDLVESLTTDGSRLFASGSFNSVGGTARTGFAVLDAASGAVGSYDAQLSGAAYTATLAGAELFLSGSFTGCANFAAPGFVRLPAPPPLGVPPLARPLALRLGVAPMPAVASARLRFELPAAARVWLDVLDLQGRQVANLSSGEEWAAGPHVRTLETRGWRPGVYLARLKTPRGSVTRRIVVER